MKIEEILANRTDLSTFLVHLTKSSSALNAKETLKKIIRDDMLVAGEPYGIASRNLIRNGLPTESQRVVCFTETPMEHLSLLASEIEGRAFKFEPYGIAVTRKQCRTLGVNPVWYLDITPGHFWLTNPLNELVRKAIETGNFDSHEISKLAPFIEQMGSSPGDLDSGAQPYKKEFWWEREWRHVGNFSLPTTYMILCPTEDMREIKEVVMELEEFFRPKVSFIDPTWSLESIIGKLAGFGGADLGPF